MSSDPISVYEFDDIGQELPCSIDLDTVRSVPWHRHNYVELSFVTRGRGVHYINDKAYRLEPGSLFLILPYQIHRFVPEGETTMELYVCNMNLKVCFTNDEIGKVIYRILFQNSDARLHLHTEGEAFDEVRRLTASMYALVHDPEAPYREILCKLRVSEYLLLFDTIRRRQSAQPGLVPEAPARKNNAVVWDILHYIHMHYHENITLASLSREFSLSPQYISTLINKHVGENLRSFLNNLRIQYASSLIVTTDLPISQIAMDVGFESMGSFFRSFHRVVGQRPTDFRKHNGSSIPIL